MRARLLLLFLAPTSAWSQCNLQCTISASATCSNDQGTLGYAIGALFTGGTGPYSYSWNQEGNVFTGTVVTPYITRYEGFGDGHGSSHHSISVTDANGCMCSSGPIVSPNLVSRFDPNVMTRTVITNVPAQTHTYKITYPSAQYMRSSMPRRHPV